MNVLSENNNFPFSERQARVVFVLLVFGGVFIALNSCCYQSIVSENVAKSAIQAFLVILAFGIVSYSLSADFSDFLNKYMLTIILFGPLILHIGFYQSPLLYLVSLITANIWAINSYSPSKTLGRWDRAIIVIYIAWIVTGIIISAGRLGYIPYHAELADAQKLRNFEFIKSLHESPRLRFILDLRYILSFIITMSLVGTAFYEAFRVELIKLPQVPPFVPDSITKKSDSLKERIVYSSLVVFASFFRSVHAVVNAVWHMIATIGFYIYQFSSKLAFRIYMFLSSATIWKAIGKVLASYAIILLFNYFDSILSIDIYLYMNKEYQLKHIWSQLDASILFIGVFFISELLIFSAYRAIWRSFSEWKVALERCAMAGAMIVLAFMISGYIVHLISLFDLVEIRGFGQLGPFLIFISLFIVLFVTYALWGRFKVTDKEGLGIKA